MNPSPPYPARGILPRLRTLRPGAKRYLIAGLSLAAIVLTLSLPPLPQPPAYHQFADQRGGLGIPNVLNVLSNAPLSLAGALGLGYLARGGGRLRAVGGVSPTVLTAYRLFFLGALLTGLGSAYYHWAPDHQRLVWDRLPMTLCFMAFLTIALSGRIGAMATRLALPAFVLLGVASVIHWHLSEQNGAGDLRLYLFVQFFPMLLIPLMLLLFPPRASPATDGDILAVMGLYGLALIGDRFLDHPLFALGGVISGHSLKHLIASLAVFWLLRGLRNQAT
ncbi:MAG: alkaline phytoceramidase [Methylococcus sp.]